MKIIKVKKGFVGIAIIIFMVAVISLSLFKIIRPFEDATMKNNKLNVFLCRQQINCYIPHYRQAGEYIATTTNNDCKRCYPSGCNHPHNYGDSEQEGTIIEQFGYSSKEVEGFVENYYSPDCEYKIEFITYDTSRFECSCGALITM